MKGYVNLTHTNNGKINELGDKIDNLTKNAQSDWEQTDESALDYIKNKPIIPEGSVLYSTTGQHTDGAMTQKAVTTELNRLSDNVSQLSNPNLLINGDFKVNQRGFTSIEATTSADAGQYYTVDRWEFRPTSTRFGKVELNSNGGLDFSCYSVAISIAQILESADTERLKGKTVTATIKVSAITGNSPLQLWIRDDSSWGNYGQINITSTGTYSVTGTIPSNINGNVLVYISYDNFQGQTTASIDWVKLEVGSQSTDFSPRSYAEELAMCQRYFINIPADLTGYSGYTANNGDYAIITVPLPVPMRTVPTITVKNLGYLRLNGQIIAPTQILVYGIINNCLNLRCNATLSAYYTICLMQAEFELDAEVY